jgi:hypothetical protein
VIGCRNGRADDGGAPHAQAALEVSRGLSPALVADDRRVRDVMTRGTVDGTVVALECVRRMSRPVA